MLSAIIFLYLCSWISYGDAACSAHIIQTFTNDVVLSASSEYAAKNRTYDYGVSRGVLNYTEFTDKNGVVYMGAWTAETNDHKQYIQIQLTKDFLIKGIITQGKNGCCQEWVTEYRLFYGDDCNSLRVLDSGNGTRFRGNTDENTMVSHLFQFPVHAKCVRIVPEHWHNKISMRVDLIGCTNHSSSTSTRSTPVPMTTPIPVTQTVFLPGVCSTNLLTTNSSVSTITASSIKDKTSTFVSYSPDEARLYSREETNTSSSRFMGGWSPQTSDPYQYLQVEFSKPTVINGVVTQGKNGCCKKWVKKFKVSYSTDCKTWNVSGGGAGQVFIANVDEDTPVTNVLICPTVVKCIRIEPLEWNNEIGMRFEFIGCPTKKGFSNQSPSSGTNNSNLLASQTTATTVSTSSSPTQTTVPSTTSTTSVGANCRSYLFSHQPYQQNIKMTASSELKEFDKTNDHSADRGRLHSTETMAIGVMLHGGWTAAFKDLNQFIQVQLPSVTTITGIVTQGRDGNDKEWVSKYRVLYSADCKQWSVVMGPTGSAFKGNTDSSTEVTNMFSRPVQAKCIKINPEAFNNQISMRMDLIGCFRLSAQQSTLQTTTVPSTTAAATTTTTTPTTNSVTTNQGPLCQESLLNNSTLGSLVNLTATSQFHNPTTGTDPSRALLDTKSENVNLYTLLGGWAPSADGKTQYIQATFDSARLIHSVVTQGLDGKNQWVTKYTIQYSDDCVNWQTVQNSKEFMANYDDTSKVTNKFACPVLAKCIRLYPTEWNTHSGLRLDILGCEVIGGMYHNISPTTVTPTTTLSTSTTNGITTNSSVAQTPTTSPLTTKSSTTTGTTLLSSNPNTNPTTKLLSTSSSTQSTTTSPTTSSSTSPSTNASTTLPSTNPTTSTTQSSTSPVTHITHKIFPTGVAPNYDKRDPLDCKRALIIDPCTIPLVKKHCFYSCNRNTGMSVSSGTNLPTVSTHSASVSSLEASSMHSSILSTDQMSTNTLQSSPMQSSLTFQSQSIPFSVIHSSIKTDLMTSSLSMSTAISTNTMIASVQNSVTSASSITPQMSSSSHVLSTKKLVSPTSSLAPTSHITTPPVTHITHITLPTGQATIYNPLDPLDCKRSLIVFNCSLSIVAKHCPHSCSKKSTVSSSLPLFPSSANSFSSTKGKSTTSSLSGSSLLPNSLSSMRNPSSSALTSVVSNSNISPSPSTLSSSSSSNMQTIPSSISFSSLDISSSTNVPSSMMSVLSVSSSQSSSKHAVSQTSTIDSSTVAGYMNGVSSYPSQSMPESSLSHSLDAHISSILSGMSTDHLTITSSEIQSLQSNQPTIIPISSKSSGVLSSHFIQQSNSGLHTSAIGAQVATNLMSPSTVDSSSAMSQIAAKQATLSRISTQLPSLKPSQLSMTTMPSAVLSSLSSTDLSSSDSSVLSPVSPSSSIPVATSRDMLSSNVLMSSNSAILPSLNILPTSDMSINPSTTSKSSDVPSTNITPTSDLSVNQLAAVMTSDILSATTLSNNDMSVNPSSIYLSSNIPSTNILSASDMSINPSAVYMSSNVPSTHILSASYILNPTSVLMSTDIPSTDLLSSNGMSNSPSSVTNLLPSSDMSINLSTVYMSSDVLSTDILSSSVMSVNPFAAVTSSGISSTDLISASDMSKHPSTDIMSSDVTSSNLMSVSVISSVFTSLVSTSDLSISQSSLVIQSSVPPPSSNMSPSLAVSSVGMLPLNRMSIKSSDALMTSELSSLSSNVVMSSVPPSIGLLSSGDQSSSALASVMSSDASVFSTDSLVSSKTSISNQVSLQLSQTPSVTASPSLQLNLNSPVTSVPVLPSTVSTFSISSTQQVTSTYVSSSLMSNSISVSSLTSASTIPASMLQMPSSTTFSSNGHTSSLATSVPSTILPPSSVMSSMSASLTCVPISMSSDSNLGVFPSTVSSNLMSQNSDMSLSATSMEYSSMSLSPSGLSTIYMSSSQTVMPLQASVTCFYVPLTMASVSTSSSVQSALLSSQLIISPFTSMSTIIATSSQQLSSIASTTPITNTPKQTTTTPTHITHVKIPTGVASIYNSKDPVDCKRTLNFASCSISVVAKHCPYSCGTHPRKRRSSLTNKSKSINNTTENGKIMEIKNNTSFFGLAMSAVKKMIKVKIALFATRSWYDPKDPLKCQKLIKKMKCTDLFYGSTCKWSCLKKRHIEGIQQEKQRLNN